MADLTEPTLLERFRALDLLYVRDLVAVDAGILDEADSVTVLSAAPADDVAIGHIGWEWLAVVRSGHAVFAEFLRQPTLAEVLQARELHLERLALTEPPVDQPAGRGPSRRTRPSNTSSSRHRRHSTGSSSPVG